MHTYFSNFIPQYQCGFCKGYSAQHCLLAMAEKMKEARYNKTVCAADLTDLSKTFECLLHDVLIAKLHVFGGFDFMSLKVIHAYLNDRIQVTKVGTFYSETLQILYGVPQGSVLGPRLFKVHLYRPFPSGALQNRLSKLCRQHHSLQM